MAYYYLVSSLPDLRTDADAPITYAEFLNLCESNVSSRIYRLLQSLTVDSDEGPLLDEWAAVYGKLSAELNYQRSLRLGKSCAAPSERDAGASGAVTAALAAKNPLEAERILLGFEFDCLDQLVSLHYYDNHVLFGYAIKLKLLERLSCFEHEKGKKEFQHLFESVQQKVLSL